MTSTLPKLIGAVVVVAVIGGAVVMVVKGHSRQQSLSSSILLAPHAIADLDAPPPAPPKPKIKRDMLDYEEPAPMPAQTATKPDVPMIITKPAAPLPGPVPPLTASPLSTTRVILGQAKPTGQMKLESSQMQPDRKISMLYTCYQKNLSPPLSWSGAPSGTKNFVVVMEGPDRGLGHPMQWGVYNIPASQTSLPEALPKTPTTDKGEQAETEVGAVGYAGPCVPKGRVTYTFSVFALDTDLKLRPGATRDELFKAINGHIIDTAKLSVMHYFRD